MPLYEYRCAQCSLLFEELVATSSAAVRCPSCQGEEVVRQLSVFAAPASSASPALGASCGPGGCGEGACETGAPRRAGGCCGGGGCCH